MKFQTVQMTGIFDYMDSYKVFKNTLQPIKI
jgi:hypothetical protein